MSVFTSLVENRKIVLNRVNEELRGEGLPEVFATNEAYITDGGIVWHELMDTRGYLTYATSHPFNRRNVTVVSEKSEAIDFDANIL